MYEIKGKFSRVVVEKNFDVQAPDFLPEPEWLRKLFEEGRSKLTRANLTRVRERRKVGCGPWMEDLWDFVSNVGLSGQQVFANCAVHSKTVPVSITSFPFKDFSDYLPKQLQRAYWAVPFSLVGPCLSVGVVEPDVISKLQQERMRLFAKLHRIEGDVLYVPFIPSELQFVLISPSGFKSIFSQGGK